MLKGSLWMYSIPTDSYQCWEYLAHEWSKYGRNIQNIIESFIYPCIGNTQGLWVSDGTSRPPHNLFYFHRSSPTPSVEEFAVPNLPSSISWVSTEPKWQHTSLDPMWLPKTKKRYVFAKKVWKWIFSKVHLVQLHNAWILIKMHLEINIGCHGTVNNSVIDRIRFIIVKWSKIQ